MTVCIADMSFHKLCHYSIDLLNMVFKWRGVARSLCDSSSSC